MIWLLLLRFVSVLWLVELVSSDNPRIPIARPGCRESCANATSDVKIPFPFGIGPGCYHDPWYEIICNPSSFYSSSDQTARPYLNKFNLEVLSIDSCLDSSTSCDMSGLKLKVMANWERNFTSDVGGSNSSRMFAAASIDLGGSPFSFSADRNVIVVNGCPVHVAAVDRKGDVIGGCFSVCEASHFTGLNQDSVCDGHGCCVASLYTGPHELGIDFYRFYVTNTTAINTDSVTVGLLTSSLSWDGVHDYYTTELYWTPPPLSNYQNTSSVNCMLDCAFSHDRCDHICTCTYDHKGNPYLPHGCQAIDPCRGGGNHSLHCMTRALLGVTLCMGTMLFLLSCYGFYHLVRRRRQITRRTKFLKRIRARLLEQEQQTTLADGAVERTQLFTATELEKATDCFNANQILGQGGQGTVYKGMLPNGRVVAIKKARMTDESQLEQFINEVVILSKINHRNVVKLLGCCLDLEAPLLVYEFVPNGTLSQHIHSPSEGFPITWRTRLRIAAESAAAIAYLHSSSSTPIYHRDIKSSNILLDERYNAKVSDFGISRTIMIDQTHLTTCVQGTFGYLDPEYFRSNQFTEKSDVYSFGVVLAELLTSKKPVSPPDQSGGWRNLAMEFLLHMNNSTLSEIVDARVLEEAKEEDLLTVAEVATRCLYSIGKQRPTMKEVASALEGIRYPTLPSTREQNHLRGDDVVMEMESICNDYMSSPSFFRSENGIGNSYSIEIQPLKHNTV